MLIVDKIFAGSRKKTIHGWLVNVRGFIPTFALDCPKIPFNCSGYQIYAGILAAKILLVGKLVPKPYMAEFAFIYGRGSQKRLHKPLEACPLITLGEGNCTVFYQYFLKTHSAMPPALGLFWNVYPRKEKNGMCARWCGIPPMPGLCVQKMNC